MVSLEDFYVRVISPPVVWVLVSIVASGLLAIYSYQLALILFVFQVLAALIIPVMVRYLSRKSERNLIQYQADLSAALVDGIQGMAEIRVFDATESQSDLIQSILKQLSVFCKLNRFNRRSQNLNPMFFQNPAFK